MLAATEARAAQLAALDEEAVHLPAWDVMPLDHREPSLLSQGRRLAALRRIDEAKTPVIVCGPEAAAMALPDADLAKRGLSVEEGGTLEREGLDGDLRKLGYKALPRVDKPGGFAVHGQTIDIWPIDGNRPFRIRLDGAEVKAITAYDPETMLSREETCDALLVPVAVANPNEIDGELVTAHDWPLHAERRTVLDVIGETGTIHTEADACERGAALIAAWDKEEEEHLRDGAPTPPRSGWLNAEEWQSLVDRAEPFALDDLPPLDGGATGDALQGELLSEGDRVVHLHHGIGIYRGVECVDIDGQPTDCFAIEFSDGELKVASHEADLLWRYGEADTNDGPLDKMGGGDWLATIASLATEMRQTAVRLREALDERGERTAPTVEWASDGMARLDKAWHSLTIDQREACDAVAADMTGEGEHTHQVRGRGVRPPMDRLVCGDVGFGKTEVILRSAAAVVFAGHQAVIAAPTVLLAKQHEQVFRKRLKPLGIAVHAIIGGEDEARVKAEADLRTGEPCVVVGTHALASDDVEFGNVALLALDEEQRFGAELKDSLRAKAQNAHVLATTATPIPRTTMAAMVGLRSVSTLRTPLPGRSAIRTDVLDWDERKLRRAIVSERAAGGRSLVIVPRIADHEKVLDELRRLVPDLRIENVHGKMTDDEAAERLGQLASGELDVLVATTIIETGIDLRTANLIAVLDASQLGVGQLHQLRGRVGRGERQGRAMLFTDCPWTATKPSEGVKERLRILAENDWLGAGFAIAARDLEQRGSGDLFGDAQTGHTQRLGIELYGHLLREALNDRLDQALDIGTVRVVVPGGLLPEDWVPQMDVRARLYGRIAKAGDEDELKAIRDEMADRFGPSPAPARELLRAARLRLRARAHGFGETKLGPKAIAVTFPAEVAHALRDVLDGAGQWKGDKLVVPHEGDAIAALEDLLERICDARTRREAA